MSAPPRPRPADDAAETHAAGGRPGGAAPPGSPPRTAWADPAQALPADVEEALTLEARLVVVEALVAMSAALAIQQLPDPAAEVRRWSEILANVERAPATLRPGIGGLILERYKAKMAGGFDEMMAHIRTLVDAFIAGRRPDRRRRR